MNLENLTKEQKQLFMLGAIIGLTGLYAGFRFGLQPLANQWGQKQSELETLETELYAARRLVANREQTRTELTATSEALIQAAGDYVPTKENPLSWATQKIYFQARFLGVDIEAVSEIGTSGVLRGLVGSGDRRFESYAVRIVTACSFENVIRFVDALQEGNPYLSVSGISITARNESPMRHAVNIDVEWPAWGNQTDVDFIRDLKGA